MSNARTLDYSYFHPATYDELRLAWRRGLTEQNVRELASEYLRGRIDQCTSDAFAEFEHRFGKYVKGQSKTPRTAKKRRSGK